MTPPVQSSRPLVIQADRALAAGLFADAITAYERALAIDPRHPDAWFNLGWARRAVLSFEGAVEAYRQAVLHGIAAPEDAHLNRAAILLNHLDRGAEAQDDLHRAIAARPDFVPAWLSLGVIAEDEGDAAAARVAYGRVLQIEPRNGRAHARLAALHLIEGNVAAAVATLGTGLERAASSSDRAEMLFVLGNARDQLGEYDAAFSAYRSANALTRDVAAVRYDARAQEQLVDALIAAPPPPPLATGKVDDRYPIFIGGMFRSGSTLVERLLARHPAITGGGERSYIPALVARWPGYPAGVAVTSPARFAAWREAYRAGLPPAPFVTDKRCDNIHHLDLVARLFPAARFVHTHRHPLDNLLSIYSLDFGGEVTYGTDLAEAAHYYGQYARLMRHWRSVAADRIVDLDYDRLVCAPGTTMAAVVQALGLPPTQDLSIATDAAGPVRTASAWQVRQPVNGRSSGRWRHYDRHLGDARRMLRAAGVGCD